MNVSELIKMRGLDVSKKIKLVRHKGSNYDMKLLYRNSMLDYYQCLQTTDAFRECDYILSFLGEEGKKATFVGAYEKISSTTFDINIHVPPIGFPHHDFLNQPLFYYELKKIDLLNDLINRLVIDWGSRNWNQWHDEKKPKQVVEVLPQGYVKDFPGFDELVLSYDELVTVIKNRDANRVWHTMLSSVAGIYLIVDMSMGSGIQYVGSACGENGLMGRWKSYVAHPHGNNERLVELLKKHPECYKCFQFSILRTLPKSMTKTQVVTLEQKYKQKLGSRAFGLNGN
ncbi:GIY-YIG nuclease family protein [Paenibacillus illinoisensis]|uniref:GIY-YIG nuclease family protein n=1 Tax=Paenibacillus illinoisensis TaxID=59845 RepID=UPI00301CCCC4